MRTILANGHRMLAVVLTTSLLSACGGPTTADTRPLVVVTTTILGDVVTNLAGGSARVHVLMPPGADPHEYAASASDVALIRGADLVIANGLSLEFGLADTLDSLPESVPVLAVGDMVDPRHFVGGAPDPHFWFDPMRMSDAVEIIRAALDAAAPGQADAIDIAASAYQAELAGLDAEVDALVSVVPPDRRLLVANHAFLGYFAERYGFEVVGSVISGGSTVEEPSASDLAALADTIEQRGVPVVFAEASEPTTLADTLAAEAGGLPVVVLLSGALPEGGSYVDLIRNDAALIANALK
jgi:zinc/manganese transport system substrate-binding protein